MRICKRDFIIVSLGCVYWGACVAHLESLPVVQLDAKQVYWAKQSFYGGIFFDDDRYGFISPIPFERLTCLKSPMGDYIIPPPSDEVITFGTRVEIQKIEWPTGQNMIMRPLLTPRYYLWVYLTVALERGNVTLNRKKTYIMLAPENIRTSEDFWKWWSRYFTTQDNNLIFLNLIPSERALILKPSK